MVMGKPTSVAIISTRTVWTRCLARPNRLARPEISLPAVGILLVVWSSMTCNKLHRNSTSLTEINGSLIASAHDGDFPSQQKRGRVGRERAGSTSGPITMKSGIRRACAGVSAILDGASRLCVVHRHAEVPVERLACPEGTMGTSGRKGVTLRGDARAIAVGWSQCRRGARWEVDVVEE